MADHTIRFAYITDPATCPRFVPDPRLRKLGFVREVLRHPDGRWFSIEELMAWHKTRMAEIAQQRALAGDGRRLPRLPRAAMSLLFGDGTYQQVASLCRWLHQVMDYKDGDPPPRIVLPGETFNTVRFNLLSGSRVICNMDRSEEPEGELHIGGRPGKPWLIFEKAKP